MGYRQVIRRSASYTRGHLSLALGVLGDRRIRLDRVAMRRADGPLQNPGARVIRRGEPYESGGNMITVNACPRCHGAVLEYLAPATDSALCVNCGWRQPHIPPDIQAQVEAHLGEPFLREDRSGHHRVGTGKPPLSGWDRVKRRRARQAARAVEAARGLPDTGRKLVRDSSVVA